jgi:hypothetical protein
MPTFHDVERARGLLSHVAREYWLHQNLYSWQWWSLLAVAIIPWLVWWKLVDKKRVIEISLYGALIAMIAVLLDLIGTNLMLWGYPQQVFWFLIPPLLPIDLTVMPVEHMVVYQYFRTWKSFVFALIALAAFSSFVVEPLFSWIGLYKLYTWKYLYSVPIYIVKAIIVRLAIEKLLLLQKR